MRCVLGPVLCPGDNITLDNLTAYKDNEDRAFIEPAQAELRHLPPYKPQSQPQGAHAGRVVQDDRSSI